MTSQSTSSQTKQSSKKDGQKPAKKATLPLTGEQNNLFATMIGMLFGAVGMTTFVKGKRNKKS